MMNVYPRLNPMPHKFDVIPAPVSMADAQATMDLSLTFRPQPLPDLTIVGYVDGDNPLIDYMMARATRWSNGMVLCCLYQVYNNGKHQHFAGYFACELPAACNTFADLEQVITDYVANQFSQFACIPCGADLAAFQAQMQNRRAVFRRINKDYDYRVGRFIVV